jgi:L-ascorbate metabolism protein UlaG (beta-lactamase superfamily)
MRIYKYIHSCLLVEEGNEKILFDPGVFSFVEGKVRPETFQDVSTIILTHQHPDHVDINALKNILAQSQATVVTNTEGKDVLAKEGIEVQVLEAGEYQTKNFTIRALGVEHAAILAPTLPQNTAYILNDTFLNPGDSFAPGLSALKGIQALAVPSMAPWTSEVVIAQFAQDMAPKIIIPVHDGYAKDFFLAQRYANYERYFSPIGIKFQKMSQPGDFVDVE